MIKEMLKRENSYDIPYTEAVNGDEQKIVIVIHGFGSSKESPTAQMMLNKLPEYGIGAVAFDFPAHGESPVDGDMMTVEGCVADLKDIEEMVKAKYPEAEISYFGSSYGAYIALNHITINEVQGAKLFCRSGAVNMPEIFSKPTAEQQAEFDENGYIMLDYDPGRPLKLTWDFIEDLLQHDLFQAFDKHGAAIKMIHGDMDEDVDYKRVKDFVQKFDISLITIEGGDHRLSIQGAPERVLEEAVAFILE